MYLQYKLVFRCRENWWVLRKQNPRLKSTKVKRSFFNYCKKEKKYFKIAVGQLNQCSYLHFQTCEFYRNNETLLFKNLQILKVLRKHTPRGWKSAEIKRPGLFFFLEKHVSAIEKWNFFDGELRFLAVLGIV